MKNHKHEGLTRNAFIIAIAIATVFVMISLSAGFYFLRKRKLKGKGLYLFFFFLVEPNSLIQLSKLGENLLKFDVEMSLKHNSQELPELNQKRKKGRKKRDKLLFFSFSSVRKATDNFSDANKLGHGGFGPVYKVLISK